MKIESGARRSPRTTEKLLKDVQLASSPWGFRMMPLADQCQWLQSNHFKYICGQFAKFPGMFDMAMTDADIAAALKLVRSHGLSYASFNADGDFMVPSKVEDQVALCCSQIDRAAQFAPKVIIVFAGWQPITTNAIYDQVSAALKAVARHAARYQLPVALENHGGLTARAEQINRILDGAREDNLGVNYDPANFTMYGEDPLRELNALKHPLLFTHFKSVKIAGGKKVYCRIKEGSFDYPSILQALARRYQGLYAIEYEETADVLAGAQDDLYSLRALLGKSDPEKA